jgi:hypothetical protein
MSLLNLFAVGGPSVEILMRSLSTSDALSLRKTCKFLYHRLGSSFTPGHVEDLTRIFQKSTAHSFSLADAPEMCRRDRRFVSVAVQKNCLAIEDAGALRRNPLVCKLIEMSY